MLSRRQAGAAVASLALALVLARQSVAEDAPASPPSPFGIFTSARWAYGAQYARQTLKPVANPNPEPEIQPRRDHPFDLAVSADGTKVYVGLQGSELEPGSELAVYSVTEDRVTQRIRLALDGAPGEPGSSPYRLTLHPGGRFLYVTNRFSNFATVVDTQTDTVTSEVPLDFYCQAMVWSTDGRQAYVANRYLDQLLVLDVAEGGGAAGLRVIGGFDDATYASEIHPRLRRRCGSSDCHGDGAQPSQRGARFYAGSNATRSFRSALPHLRPGNPAESRLLTAGLRTRHGGYGDQKPVFRAHPGGVVFPTPDGDADFNLLRRWVADTKPGPGVPVGNFRSKPTAVVRSTDGRHLFVGNTGTQDISIIDVPTLQEVGAIYLQNAAHDLRIYRPPDSNRDYLLVTTEGVGYGVAGERDPFGGETWDRENPAAQFSVWTDRETGHVYPREQQRILGPYDSVDGTHEIKFRDIQNDLVFIDLGAVEIPMEAPEGGLEYLLLPNRYEAHQSWVRYTSDTAESTYGDIKGDIPPDLMRVIGAKPEKMVIVGDQLFVTMQASGLVQQWRIDPRAADPSNILMPVAVYETGLQPIGIAAGPADTPAAGKIFVASFLGGTLTVIDTKTRATHEVVIDPSVVNLPVPSTNAERGEIFAHSAIFSTDSDTACVHCHHLDMGDGRPWGVSQVVGQEYLPAREGEPGNGRRSQLVIGGLMGTPQMRGLFAIQPFFYEGAISAFEPRSMIQEHAPADDLAAPLPDGDYTGVDAHYQLTGAADIQSKMDSSSNLDATLEERRDEMFRERSMRYFGKAFTLRDFQRFVGEWQISEPRLMPNPYDQQSASVERGRILFEDPQVGCKQCHPPPHFAKKDFPDNREQAMAPLVIFTARDSGFTLISMNRLDFINQHPRDLEPWDPGRAQQVEGHLTTSQLRGIWDRPPVFLHNGMARTLHEVVAAPGHPALRRFKYAPLIGGRPERPDRWEVGFNMTLLFAEPTLQVAALRHGGGRLGFDTHGGTSQLTGRQVDDLVHFMLAIE